MSQVFSLIQTWKGSGQLWENVMHYQMEETGLHSPEEYAAALIIGWRTNVLGSWLDCLSEDVQLVSSRSKRVSGAGSTTVIATYADGVWPGTISGHIDNSAVAAILEFAYFAPPSEAFPDGRTNIGKIFLAGMPDAATAENALQAAELTALTTLINVIVVPFTTAVPAVTATYVVWDRKNKVPHIPVGRAISPKIGIQKRRLLPVYP